ncbi:MAG: T9SS type A sorting domain-containing protein [Crocinitomicaceae bacterium]
MKVLLPITFLALLISCSTEEKNNNKTNPLHFVGADDGAMSEGTATSPGSRSEWEQLRLADPATGLIPPNMRQKELAFAQTLPSHQYKAYNWDHRGPFNVGGRTRAIALDVLDENIWLAAGVSGGIWRSTDAGATWTNTTDPLEMHSYNSLLQDTRPGHESTWYAGTGETYGIVSQTSFEARFSGNGIMKSTDNGVTWNWLTSTQSNTPTTHHVNGDMDFVWRMVIDPTNTTEDVVLAAVYNGVKRSDDGGASWTDVLGFQQGGFSNPGSDFVEIEATSTGVFYATLSADGPSKGIFRSDDGGLTWTDIKPSTFPTSWGRLSMAINPEDENIVWFFGVANTGEANGHGLFRYEYLSGDGSGSGGTWSDRSANLPDQSCYVNAINAEIGKLSTQSSFDLHIAIHPADTSVVYVAGTSIWRNKDAFTHDSTNTWIGGYQCDPLPYDDLNWNLSYPNHHPDQHWMMFLPSDPSVLINANDGGVYRTVDNLADSVDWVSLNNGYITTQFYAVAIEPGVAISDIVVGGLQDNGTWMTNSSDENAEWKYVGSGDGMYCALRNGADYYLTSKQRGKLYLKEIESNGNVMAHERIDPEGGPATYNWANSFKLDPNNNKGIFWNGRTKLWRLDNLEQLSITGDRTNKEPNFWVELDSSLIDPQAALITDIEMCETMPNTVWYGTSNAYLYRLDDAYGLTDGPHRVNISGPDFPNNAYISCVAVDPFDADKITVTFANYNVPSVFATTDGGLTWEDISGNLEENVDGTGNGPAVFWAENYVDGTIFVGTSTGLYTTNFKDGENTVWTLESGVGNVSVDHMDFRTYDGYFVVGTHGQGVYSTHLQPGFVSIEEEQSSLKVVPTLINQNVTITAPEGTREIALYNLQGQKVLSKTVSQLKNNFDVSGLKSGAYIVVAISDTQTWTEKVVKR